MSDDPIVMAALPPTWRAFALRHGFVWMTTPSNAIPAPPPGYIVKATSEVALPIWGTVRVVTKIPDSRKSQTPGRREQHTVIYLSPVDGEKRATYDRMSRTWEDPPPPHRLIHDARQAGLGELAGILTASQAKEAAEGRVEDHIPYTWSAAVSTTQGQAAGMPVPSGLPAPWADRWRGVPEHPQWSTDPFARAVSIAVAQYGGPLDEWMPVETSVQGEPRRVEVLLPSSPRRGGGGMQALPRVRWLQRGRLREGSGTSYYWVVVREKRNGSWVQEDAVRPSGTDRFWGALARAPYDKTATPAIAADDRSVPEGQAAPGADPYGVAGVPTKGSADTISDIKGYLGFALVGSFKPSLPGFDQHTYLVSWDGKHPARVSEGSRLVGRRFDVRFRDQPYAGNTGSVYDPDTPGGYRNFRIIGPYEGVRFINPKALSGGNLDDYVRYLRNNGYADMTGDRNEDGKLYTARSFASERGTRGFAFKRDGTLKWVSPDPAQTLTVGSAQIEKIRQTYGEVIALDAKTKDEVPSPEVYRKARRLWNATEDQARAANVESEVYEVRNAASDAWQDLHVRFAYGEFAHAVAALVVRVHDGEHPRDLREEFSIARDLQREVDVPQRMSSRLRAGFEESKARLAMLEGRASERTDPGAQSASPEARRMSPEEQIYADGDLEPADIPLSEWIEWATERGLKSGKLRDALLWFRVILERNNERIPIERLDEAQELLDSLSSRDWGAMGRVLPGAYAQNISTGLDKAIKATQKRVVDARRGELHEEQMEELRQVLGIPKVSAKGAAAFYNMTHVFVVPFGRSATLFIDLTHAKKPKGPLQSGLLEEAAEISGVILSDAPGLIGLPTGVISVKGTSKSARATEWDRIFQDLRSHVRPYPMTLPDPFIRAVQAMGYNDPIGGRFAHSGKLAWSTLSKLVADKSRFGMNGIRFGPRDSDQGARLYNMTATNGHALVSAEIEYLGGTQHAWLSWRTIKGMRAKDMLYAKGPISYNSHGVFAYDTAEFPHLAGIIPDDHHDEIRVDLPVAETIKVLVAMSTHPMYNVKGRTTALAIKKGAAFHAVVTVADDAAAPPPGWQSGVSGKSGFTRDTFNYTGKIKNQSRITFGVSPGLLLNILKLFRAAGVNKMQLRGEHALGPILCTPAYTARGTTTGVMAVLMPIRLD